MIDGMEAPVAEKLMTAEEFFINAFWVTLLWTMFVVIGAETVKGGEEMNG